MSTFAEARTALATALRALTIASPEALSPRMVFEHPPAALDAGQLPCFIFASPELRDGPPHHTFGYAEERWTFAVGLVVAHEAHRLEWSYQVLDAFTQAVLTMAYAKQTLGDSVFFIDEGSPRVFGASREEIAGLGYPHRNFEFDVTVGGGVTTGA